MKALDPVSKAFELSNKLCSRQSKIMEIPYSAPLYKPLIKSMSFDQNNMMMQLKVFYAQVQVFRGWDQVCSALGQDTQVRDEYRVKISRKRTCF